MLVSVQSMPKYHHQISIWCHSVRIYIKEGFSLSNPLCSFPLVKGEAKIKNQKQRNKQLVFLPLWRAYFALQTSSRTGCSHLRIRLRARVRAKTHARARASGNYIVRNVKQFDHKTLRGERNDARPLGRGTDYSSVPCGTAWLLVSVVSIQTVVFFSIYPLRKKISTAAY